MSIFDHKKTIVGLFSSDRDVEQTVNNLEAQGFYQQVDGEVIVINRDYLTDTVPEKSDREGAAAPSSGTGSAIHPMIYPLVSVEAETDFSIQRIQDTLTDMGIADEEAAYFAQRAARGNSLVIVHTSEERAPEALRVMEQAPARTYVM